MNQRRHTNDAAHPCEADLAAFAVGRLQGLRFAIVEQHVIQCDRCAAVVSRTPGDAFVDHLRQSEQEQPRDAETRTRQCHDRERPAFERLLDTTVGVIKSRAFLLPLLIVLVCVVVLVLM